MSIAVGSGSFSGEDASRSFGNAGTVAIGGNAQAGAGAVGQTNATAVGFQASANAVNATAVGANDTASGNNSFAAGNGSTASGTSGVAIGDGANSGPGTNAIAIGTGAVATGSIAIGAAASAANGGAAFGDNSTATGANATAIGPGATATFANSTAIGNGATATAANQVVIGTASNTYRMPGITSAASLAAQNGPVSFVTSDAGGNLATSTFNPASLTSLQSQVTSLQSQVVDNRLEARTGTAIALAAGSMPALQPGRKFALAAGYGNFEGTNAFAVGATALLYDSKQYAIVANAGGGIGLERNVAGGRGSVSIQW
jgi:hypothetical protein